MLPRWAISGSSPLAAGAYGFIVGFAAVGVENDAEGVRGVAMERPLHFGQRPPSSAGDEPGRFAWAREPRRGWYR